MDIHGQTVPNGTTVTYVHNCAGNTPTKCELKQEYAARCVEYCREKGLFVEQLKQWQTSCMDANKPDQKMSYQDSKEQRAANKRIKELEKELNRKEKALAETAALLVLREKYNALWEAKEEE